jgi:hypothetical protein
MLSLCAVRCLSDFGEVGIPIFLGSLIVMEMKDLGLHLDEIVVQQRLVMCALLGWWCVKEIAGD